MSFARKTFSCLAVVATFALLPYMQAQAGVSQGDKLPAFQMKTPSGELYTEKNFSQNELGVLYLFKPDKCPSCIEGLRQLQAVNKEVKDDRMMMMGVDITSDPQLSKLTEGLGIKYPVVSSDGKSVSAIADGTILPVTVFTGPNGQVIRVLQGGGGQIPKIATTMAEQQLQRKKTDSARAIFGLVDSPEEKGKAQAGIGYTYLKEGKTEQAEAAFNQLASDPNPQLAMVGKEGMAKLYMQQGKTNEALATAQEVIKQDPNRAQAQLVMGEALHAQGDKKGAEKSLALATSDQASSDFSWQKSDAFLAMGNINQNQKPQIALKSFQEASKSNPYSVEALSNQGVALQKLGEPEKAIEVFNNVKQLDPNDRLIHSLLRQAQEAMAQKKDIERQQYIDGMVKDLVTRFKEKKAQAKPQDDWTSPMGAVSILGFENNSQNSLTGRTGVEEVLKDELTRELTSQHVSVVDRAILDKVLAELKLGSSDLANPKTALELGKITAAHIITTGSFHDSEQGSLMSLRLVETETTDIFLAVSEKGQGAINPTELAKKLASQIASKVREKFPQKGRIVKIKDNEVIINLGQRQAVTNGQVFNVLSKGEEIDLGNGEKEYDYEPLGKIEIIRTTDKVAYAKVVEKKGDWKEGQKIIAAQN